MNLTVTGEGQIQITGDVHLTVQGDLHIKAANIFVEADEELCLSCGGSSIDLTPATLGITGASVLINSGGTSMPPSRPARTVPIFRTRTSAQFRNSAIWEISADPAATPHPTTIHPPPGVEVGRGVPQAATRVRDPVGPAATADLAAIASLAAETMTPATILSAESKKRDGSGAPGGTSRSQPVSGDS